MQYRELGSTGWNISSVSFGSWAIGSAWGTVDDKNSLAALHSALDGGVNFFDTADVYGDGHSERLLAQLKKERKENFYVATKAGRRLSPHTAGGYNRKNITAFVERSLKNLNADSLDLLQLHCPPAGVYYNPEVFELLDDLVADGKIRHYGVSVEKVEEAIKAIEYPGVQSVQIIFNIFRQRPHELFFREAARRKVGILARLPLSSGMLSGKMTSKSSFESGDHRSFNRKGEMFDRGETFSGLDYETGLHAVELLRNIKPEKISMAQMALRWILMFREVTCVIPGAKRPEQVEENIQSADLPPFSDELMSAVESIYNKEIRKHVHQLW